VISSSKCGVVLFVVLCDVWFRVLSRCSFISYWKIDISQLQILGRQRWRSESMWISVTWVLSYYL